MKTNRDMPTALTVIKAIAEADGVLKGSPRYLTKLQMIYLCRRWLDKRTFSHLPSDADGRATGDAKGGGK